MKKQILGFMNVTSLINNNVNKISELGELSTWSATYSKDKGIYVDSLAAGFGLTTFSVTDIASETQETLTNVESRLILRVAKACKSYADTHTAPLDPTDFRLSIQADFYNDIESLEFGDLVSAANTTLPAWFSFTSKAGDKNIQRIWFSDPYFQVEYPEYAITVVSPLADMNDFLKPWATAVQLLEQRTNLILIDETQALKNLNPETYLRYFEFEFVNRANPSQKKLTSWYILVYGEAGNDDDAIKDKIIDELVKNTGQPESIWEPIFPELFKRTEFMILPQWHNLSIPNMSNLTSLYSSFIRMRDGIDYAIDKCPAYTPAWVEENCDAWPMTYKSIAIISVNGPNNIEGKRELSKLYPDYIPVDTSDPDFQRMSINTQGWVNFMLKIISSAETSTGMSSLPQGIRRIKRGDLYCLSGTYDKAKFVVTQRRNFV